MSITYRFTIFLFLIYTFIVCTPLLLNCNCWLAVNFDVIVDLPWTLIVPFPNYVVMQKGLSKQWPTLDPSFLLFLFAFALPSPPLCGCGTLLLLCVVLLCWVKELLHNHNYCILYMIAVGFYLLMPATQNFTRHGTCIAERLLWAKTISDDTLKLCV